MRVSFSEWMVLVDRAVWSRAGVSVHDLPDAPFRDWYDDRVAPSVAARRVIRYAKEG